MHRARAVASGLLAGYFGLLAALGGYTQWQRLGILRCEGIPLVR